MAFVLAQGDTCKATNIQILQRHMHSHSEICTEALCKGRGDTCKARGDEGAGTGEEMLVTQILTSLGIMKT